MRSAVAVLELIELKPFLELPKRGAVDFAAAAAASVAHTTSISIAARGVVGFRTDAPRRASERALVEAFGLAVAGVTAIDAAEDVQAARKTFLTLADATLHNEDNLRLACTGDISATQVSVLFNALKTVRAAVCAAVDWRSMTSLLSDSSAVQQLHWNVPGNLCDLQYLFKLLLYLFSCIAHLLG
jgi:hypothetical protein